MMEEKVSSALSQEDKDTINKQVESGLEWLSQNPSADVDVYESKQKEIESVAMPIMSKLGGQPGSDAGTGGMPAGMDFSNMPGMEEMVKNAKAKYEAENPGAGASSDPEKPTKTVEKPESNIKIEEVD